MDYFLLDGCMDVVRIIDGGWDGMSVNFFRNFVCHKFNVRSC